MSNVVQFSKKQEQQEGVELKTLDRSQLINVFFPGANDWETIVVQTTIENITSVIKSATHQKAVWHALAQLDEMRDNMYDTAEGVGGFFGDPAVDLQIGFAV